MDTKIIKQTPTGGVLQKTSELVPTSWYCAIQPSPGERNRMCISSQGLKGNGSRYFTRNIASRLPCYNHVYYPFTACYDGDGDRMNNPDMNNPCQSHPGCYQSCTSLSRYPVAKNVFLTMSLMWNHGLQNLHVPKSSFLYQNWTSQRQGSDLLGCQNCN